MIYQYMRHSGRSSQSFVSFVKEKENKVVEDAEKKDQIESEGRRYQVKEDSMKMNL
jgi:hypothetical protein